MRSTVARYSLSRGGGQHLARSSAAREVDEQMCEPVTAPLATASRISAGLSTKPPVPPWKRAWCKEVARSVVPRLSATCCSAASQQGSGSMFAVPGRDRSGRTCTRRLLAHHCIVATPSEMASWSSVSARTMPCCQWVRLLMSISRVSSRERPMALKTCSSSMDAIESGQAGSLSRRDAAATVRSARRSTSGASDIYGTSPPNRSAELSDFNTADTRGAT
mmetsp:Transcript_66852/g.183366  ORF Transcript_66852/g.183366 Transcript_66852/m.183366 type:complete len:220 (-) Transcript_66852:417-1076(-)